MRDIREFQDMLDMAHHVSVTRTPMGPLERAAQFSPFAALTDYNAAVREVARTTDERAERDEEEMAQLNGRLLFLRERLEEEKGLLPEIAVTYFVPDEHKEGGSYRTVTGRVRKIDEEHKSLVFADGTEIAAGDIYAMEETEWSPFSFPDTFEN